MLPFFMNAEQEEKFDAWLKVKNKEAIKKQLKEEMEELTDDERDHLLSMSLSDAPIPIHDDRYGYYTISFTPCAGGLRIYAHHHILDISEEIYDPSKLKDEQPEPAAAGTN